MKITKNVVPANCPKCRKGGSYEIAHIYYFETMIFEQR
jgi:hypothetical protein